MGQHRAVRRTPARAARFEQRGLKPAAMLVRALAVQVGDRARPEARLGDVGVGGTAIEPHVQDVALGLVVGQVVVGAEQRLVVGGEPGVRSLLAKGVQHTRVHRGIAQQFARTAVDVERDGHAPGPLARDHPVGTAFDHGVDAVARLRGHPARVVDGGEGELP